MQACAAGLCLRQVKPWICADRARPTLTAGWCTGCGSRLQQAAAAAAGASPQPKASPMPRASPQQARSSPAAAVAAAGAGDAGKPGRRPRWESMHIRINQGQGCLASLDCSMGARALCCMAVDCILLMCTFHLTFLTLCFCPCDCGVHASVQGPSQQGSTGGRSCCPPNQEAAAAAAKQRSSSRCCWR